MRVATYHRVSTTDQDPTMARAELARWVGANGGTIVATFEEVASGAAKRRPVLRELLDGARRRRFDVVIAWKLDRLGRTVEGILGTIRELTDAGIRVVVVDQGLDIRPRDDGSPMARAMLHLLALFAELERDLVRERTRLGVATARARGKRLGRPRAACDGAEVVRLRDAGKSWSQVAAQLGASVAVVRARAAEAAGRRATDGAS